MVSRSPDISWKNDATPVSNRFGDVYFSAEDGVAETRHVFLHGTDLPEAWDGATCYSIAETGFGTGLNFLSVWDLWRRHGPEGGRLHFVSAEAFPLAREDLERAHRHWPQFRDLSAQLIGLYPPSVLGFHRLHFDTDRVHLTLMIGEAGEMLSSLDAHIDAWFLDGFSPAANPDMWRTDIYLEMARLSRPGARVATFTVAGAVRRGLSAAGFDVDKAPGFGRKREMLRARYAGQPGASAHAPWFQPSTATKPRRVSILGAGIAGAAVAHAMRRRGAEVTLIDRSGLSAGASGNAIGLIMPRLTVDPTPAGQFHTAAFLYITRLLAQVGGVEWTQCGALQLATTPADENRFHQFVERSVLPADIMSLETQKAACDRAGLAVSHGGLFLPTAGFLHPPDLVRHLAGVDDTLSADGAEILSQTSLLTLKTKEGKLIPATDAVVLATSTATPAFAQCGHLPIRRSLGQISYLPEADLPAHPACVVTFGGYLAPARNGIVTLGATYEPLNADLTNDQPNVSASRHQKNIDAARGALPGLWDGITAESLSGRAAVRATTPDHMPIAGPAPDASFFAREYRSLQHGRALSPLPPAEYHEGLYLCAGLGSRGFVTAPLLGEMIASALYGDPMPVERDLSNAVHPARFLVRDLKRGRLALD